MSGLPDSVARLDDPRHVLQLRAGRRQLWPALTQHIGSYSGRPTKALARLDGSVSRSSGPEVGSGPGGESPRASTEVQGARLRESLPMIGAIRSDPARARWSSFELLVAFRDEASVVLRAKVPLAWYSTAVRRW